MKMYERIRAYIDSNGWKLNFVADKVGINPNRFYRLVNGESPLTIEEYEVICKGLSLDPGYFFRHNFLVSKKNHSEQAM